MPEPTARQTELFFEVFEPLPRQGPGSRACAEHALKLCAELPTTPDVLDLGCGAGAQTLHLAQLTEARSILAIDSHAPNIDRLRAAAAEHGLTDRIEARVADFAQPDHAPGNFDLIWSEGALYNIGIERALELYHAPLRPGGYLAFTEAVWRTTQPAPEVRAAFADYPAMGKAVDVVAIVERQPFTLVGHFTLPDESWWEDFYTPMLERIEELRTKYGGDGEALGLLDELAAEPAMHRRHAAEYGYEFFVLRRG